MNEIPKSNLKTVDLEIIKSDSISNFEYLKRVDSMPQNLVRLTLVEGTMIGENIFEGYLCNELIIGNILSLNLKDKNMLMAIGKIDEFSNGFIKVENSIYKIEYIM
jgi:hypothetical protein